MAENTDDTHLDNPPNNQSGNTSNEISSAANTTAVNPNESTKNMEVHHHAHHGHKNWKSYFWEFLMLFLAVFCGFLAEYQLEHLIEHQREKQYMKSLIYDLQSDTANLNEGFPLKDQRLLAIDSVFQFFEANPSVKEIPGEIFRHMKRTLWDRHYRRNSTTIDQLKNAGGLRLVGKRNVRDSIAAYDLQWQRADFWKESYVSNQEKGKTLVQKIVNANDLLNEYQAKTGFQTSKDMTDVIDVRINTDNLNEFLNFCYDQKITTTQDKRGYMAIRNRAEQLILLIKNEYKLN